MKLLFFCLAALFASLGAFSQEIAVQPPTYLKFTNPPFVINGVTYVPLRETAKALNVSAEQVLLFVFKNTIVLPDEVHGGGVTFAPARMIAEGLNQEITKSDTLLTIGEVTWEINGKLIVVDRGRQRIYAYEGLKLVYQCRTCTGKPGYTTPTGIFQTWLKSPGKFVGKFGAMFWPTFFNASIAIHSCPSDRNVKDLPDSHGCCRVMNEARKWFWQWIPGKVPSSVGNGGYYFIPEKDQIPVYVIP